jgi:glycolate oxidase FAD binding subunit
MREIDTTGDRMVRPEAGTDIIVGTGGDPAPLKPRDGRDVADAVASAAATGVRLRVRGGGSWLDAGRPITTDRALDISALSGIIDYVPGDLTLTAHGATPLADIDTVTHAHNQWLPLDPFGDPRGTLGATLATASAGPLGGSIGLPRDLALGIEVATGRGELVRGGGRVVKNVAGFDLVRLQVGAWGTLGVITEATVRLRALPEADESLAIPLPADPASLRAMLATLRSGPYTAFAAELLSPAYAAKLGLGGSGCILIRLGGNRTQVAAQRAAFAAMGDCVVLDSASTWSRLRASEPLAAIVFRVSARSSELAATWRAVADDGAVVCHASLERGIVRCIASENDADAIERLSGLSQTRRVIIERAPAAVWERQPAPAVRPLDEGMRRAFDPHGVLNPGLFGPPQ